MENQKGIRHLRYTNRILAKLSEIIFLSTDFIKSNELMLHYPPIGMLLTGEHNLDKLDSKPLFL